jgi:hypothetical protein
MKTPIRNYQARTGQDSGEDLEGLIEATILSILRRRKACSTCCPSEIPRSDSMSSAAAAAGGWRALMEPTRRVALRLWREGLLDILQVLFSLITLLMIFSIMLAVRGSLAAFYPSIHLPIHPPLVQALLRISPPGSLPAI